MKNKPRVADLDLNIDFDMFTAEEIIKIYQFYQTILNNEVNPYPKEDLIKAYNEYRSILRNPSLEKKYDAMFLKVTGISIYHIMKDS